MQPGPGQPNPIVVPPGQMQYGVNPLQLLPSRVDLIQVDLDLQRALQRSGTARYTPIQVTREGVIWDGHHAIRAAAEEGRSVDVRVIGLLVPAVAGSIMALPVR
jgi:hypothetical protein